MKDELLKDIVIDTRNRYESARRWSGIILLIAFFFHLTIFGPYLKAAGKFDDAVKEQKRLSSLKNSVGELRNEIRSLVENAKLSKTQITNMVEELRTDFHAMALAIKEIKNPIASSSTRSQAEELLQKPSFTPSMQIQSTLQAKEKVEERKFNFDETTREKMRSAKNFEELKSIILPIIKSEIITKRFTQLNDYWQQIVVPKIKKSEKSIIKKLNRLNADYPANKKIWEDAVESVREIRSTAETTIFKAEFGPNWWSTVAGKRAAIEDMGRETGRQIMGAMQRNASLEELSRMINSAVKKQERFQESLRKELNIIADKFKELGKELKAMNKGLGIVALDLKAIVRNFPLIIGLLIALVITWKAHRIRDLYWIVERIDPDSKDSTLRECILPRNVLSIMSTQPSAQALFSGVTGMAAACILAWLWICASTIQLRGWSEVSGFRLTTSTLIGIILVVLACIYRWKSESVTFNTHKC